MSELASKYDPQQVEETRYKAWEEAGYFHVDVEAPGDAYTIVIPPPNVTGILHMGHALNNTVQDIIIRFKRMQGKKALWVPGTDHAGIATQNVVEKKLRQDGLSRQDLGRDSFLKHVWEWRQQYGDRILYQLRRLGSSCDWQRTRFTMDEGLSKAVREVFVRLYEEGLIYRGSYIINWCPRCLTALSDEEAPREESPGKLYHIYYPLQAVPAGTKFRPTPQNCVEVATTRPETMLGDTAVAVHPEDERYKDWVGKTVVLPLVGRELPIIADTMVDKEFGTGAVKITPAHDPADFDTGKRHDLEFINVMTDDAKMVLVPEAYEGLDRYDCRSKLIIDLEEQGYLGAIDNHQHNVGHCYRCHTAIEPRMSPQWFVKMAPLAKPALQAARDKTIRFYPERWTKVYLNWLENIQDWCISRQIWWGHRIPVWYCDSCQMSGSRSHGERDEENPGVIVSREEPKRCPQCGSKSIRQDEDVLDTWFSSWLWPFSTLGWPEDTPDLAAFYPTQTLVTAPDIIFFWVARMIMAGYFCTGQTPFTQIYLHGVVRDIEGRKMSKSLGNSIDPIDLIDQYGVDALRYTLVTATAIGQDILLSEERVLVGRNFANKLWNAVRFALSQLEAADWKQVGDDGALLRNGALPEGTWSLADRWILSRCQQIAQRVTQSLDQFMFNDAANTLYDFIWHDVCDWYIETAKIQLKQGQQRETAAVLCYVLERCLRLLHPVMPFVTEELWLQLKSLQCIPDEAADSVMLAEWPKYTEGLVDAAAEGALDRIQEVITFIRTTRAELHVPAQSRPQISLKPEKTDQELLERSVALVQALTQSGPIAFINGDERPRDAVVGVVGGVEVFVHLKDIIDVKEESKRVEDSVMTMEKSLQSIEARLSNAKFIEQAPESVVQQSHERCKELQDALEKSRTHLELLRSMV